MGFQVYLMAGAEASCFEIEYQEPARRPAPFKKTVRQFQPGFLAGAGFQRPYYETVISINYTYTNYGNMSNIFRDPDNHLITQNFRGLCTHTIAMELFFTF